jgi:hypothetical protein
MIGGALSRPAERYPYTFGNSEFLKKYPYFLPCAVSATFSALAWVLALVFLKEVRVYVFWSFLFYNLAIDSVFSSHFSQSLYQKG